MKNRFGEEIKNLNFDKLFLVRDTHYGTHVTYIHEYPDNLFIDFFTDTEDLFEIIEDIHLRIFMEMEVRSLKKKKNRKKISND